MNTTQKLSGAVTAAMCAAGAAVLASDKCLTVSRYKVGTGRLNGELRVTVISDLHTARFGRGNRRLVNTIAATKPDIILLAGDFFDCHRGKLIFESTKDLIRALVKIAPVYFSPGNHDVRFDVETGRDHRAAVIESGATYFDGGYADIDTPAGRIRLGGIFDHGIYSEDYGPLWRDSPVYRFMLEFDDTDLPKILMMHRPNTLIYTLNQPDDWHIDAVISGHDHGGLMRLPFIGGVFCPEQGFFPKYTKGEYVLNGARMFLSAGLDGYFEFPRIFNPPDVMQLIVS